MSMRAIQARFPTGEFEQIENWRRAQPQIPNLADAMRTLVLRGLTMGETDEKRVSGMKEHAA